MTRIIHSSFTSSILLPFLAYPVPPCDPDLCYPSRLISRSGDTGSSGQIDVNRLDLGIVVQSVLAEFSTDSRVLEPSEWDLGVQFVVAVDPDCAGLLD
jgi:hypothetical protein